VFLNFFFFVGPHDLLGANNYAHPVDDRQNGDS